MSWVDGVDEDGVVNEHVVVGVDMVDRWWGGIGGEGVDWWRIGFRVVGRMRTFLHPRHPPLPLLPRSDAEHHGRLFLGCRRPVRPFRRPILRPDRDRHPVGCCRCFS